MGVFDKLKGVFGVDEDDEYEDDDMYEDEEDEVEEISPKKAVKADFNINKISSSTNQTTASNDRNISFTQGSPQLEVVLVKPERFDDASGIADSLNAKKTVVLNLENANKDVARRLVDFLSGVAYANNGQLKKIANSTFIIIPYNVDISGIGILDEVEASTNLY